MGLQQLENEAKRIIKTIESEIQADHQRRLHFCLTQNKIPTKDQKLKSLVDKLRNCVDVAQASNALPTMPSDTWRREHGTICQPLDGVDDTPLPETRTNKKGKLVFIPKE